MKFLDKISKNYYHNQKVLSQVREMYCSKRRVTSVKFTIVVNNRICFTWRDFKREISFVPPEYRIDLSQPFVNAYDNFVYYVSLTKTCNHNGNYLKHSLAWTLLRFVKAQESKGYCREKQISLRRLLKENGITRN